MRPQLRKRIFQVSARKEGRGLVRSPLTVMAFHPRLPQDLDGSLSGQPTGGWVAAYFAYNNWPECPRDAVGTFSGGTVCPWNVTIRKVSHDLILPVQLAWQNM